ncbi:unnamed protein product [Brassica oleracea var. botrytis]
MARHHLNHDPFSDPSSRVSIFTRLATTTDPDHGVSPKYPGFVPGSNPGQYDEHMNRGAGIYAVHVHQFGGHVAGLSLKLSHPSHLQCSHLNIFLILKLAAVIFLFNQDGYRQQRCLVIFATIIYLYQSGSLAPFIRWLSQGMHRAPVPPPQPRAHRPTARGDNDPFSFSLPAKMRKDYGLFGGSDQSSTVDIHHMGRAPFLDAVTLLRNISCVYETEKRGEARKEKTRLKLHDHTTFGHLSVVIFSDGGEMEFSTSRSSTASLSL